MPGKLEFTDDHACARMVVLHRPSSPFPPFAFMTESCDETLVCNLTPNQARLLRDWLDARLENDEPDAAVQIMDIHGIDRRDLRETIEDASAQMTPKANDQGAGKKVRWFVGNGRGVEKLRRAILRGAEDAP